MDTVSAMSLGRVDSLVEQSLTDYDVWLDLHDAFPGVLSLPASPAAAEPSFVLGDCAALPSSVVVKQEQAPPTNFGDVNVEEELAFNTATATPEFGGAGVDLQPFSALSPDSGGLAIGSHRALRGSSSRRILENKKGAGRRSVRPSLTGTEKKPRKYPKDTIHELEIALQLKLSEYSQLAEENAKLVRRARILEGLVHKHDETISVLSVYGPARWTQPQPPLNSRVLGILGHSDMRKAEIEYVKDMSLEEWMLKWRSYVQRLGPPVLDMEKPTADHLQAQNQLASLVKEMSAITQMVYLFNPMLVYKARCVNIATSKVSEPDDGHWETVIEKTELLPQQVKDIIGCVELCASLWSRVIEERAQLVQTVGVTSTGKLEKQHRFDATISSNHHVAVEKLNANLQREHAVSMILPGFFTFNIASPLQYARMCYYSWPWFPNANSIVTTLVRSWQQSKHEV